MMQNIILGIGTDIISIARIKASIDRRGDALLKRLYTQAEREQAMARNNGATRYLATRFAAKEAIWKALCHPNVSGGASGGVSLAEIEILANSNGAPETRLYGGALAAAQAKAGAAWQLHLSLSDDDGLALAFAVFSAP